MKKLFPILLFIFLVSLGVYLWEIDENVNQKETKTVTVSFYPIYEFTSRVAGNAVEVINIAGNNTSPHDFEPSAQDIVRIEKSDLFIFNGAGLDPWAERLESDLEDRNISILELASTITLRSATGELHKEDETMEEDDHDHGDKDPHFWVDPLNAQKEVEAIRDALIAVDPVNEGMYRSNSASYIAELQDLHNDILIGTSDCSQRTIVVSHDAFNYFADRYGLDTISISGLSPTNEPSAQQLADIVDLVKEKNITHIFFETLVSPRLSETLAEETSTDTLVLDPVAGISKERQVAGETYISVMRNNLYNIQQALQCQTNLNA